MWYLQLLFFYRKTREIISFLGILLFLLMLYIFFIEKKCNSHVQYINNTFSLFFYCSILIMNFVLYITTHRINYFFDTNLIFFWEKVYKSLSIIVVKFFIYLFIIILVFVCIGWYEGETKAKMCMYEIKTQSKLKTASLVPRLLYTFHSLCWRKCVRLSLIYTASHLYVFCKILCCCCTFLIISLILSTSKKITVCSNPYRYKRHKKLSL